MESHDFLAMRQGWRETVKTGLKQKKAEMQSSRAGKGLLLHPQKAINARRQWKRMGRWRGTLGKQQCWKASPSRLSLLLTPTIPWQLQLCHRAWRNPVSWQLWHLLRGHRNEPLLGAHHWSLQPSLELAAGLKIVQC